ncbi:hypothetical protein AAZX31_17G133000 [Glycine max]|uniref:Pectinesterase inhibitor domain-containing protein n=2 Tax=Glycine subgen. Soja TaxID=1462606 RepID=I1MUW8_SOYBN|nr:21 kDa protein [Glycine max]XP_028210177.1 21 kDa protein-like [Glycine soja]KAG4933133.1 hypothetical protein JHK87_047135 [Glycine soja]KAG5097590.1 hypothetical protein JHK82_047444 [Glycine max]KAG5102382.1 hypothetical protein JHK84_047351 [Glycine max]KRH04067.1 hypothetical protein GLYMA_17G137400v4 [Glycine max]RZB56776.1 Pectinesterase inhibitor 11 [Glycine soja]|eukprot:XP_003550896.1 21 kDa protein [Glycine max]
MASKLLLSLSLLLLTLTLHTSCTTALAKRTNPNPTITTTTDFIKSSCKATRYPAACVQTLSGHASAIRQSEQQLAVTALSVSVSKTRSCASFVKRMGSVKGMKPREYNALRDCVENMNDSVDRLSQSVKELGLVMGKGKGKKDFTWHVSNVQTWVSAAITDQDTCLDGFDGPHVDANLRASVRPRVVDASQVTSNALALVNRFASKYRSASQT